MCGRIEDHVLQSITTMSMDLRVCQRELFGGAILEVHLVISGEYGYDNWFQSLPLGERVGRSFENQTYGLMCIKLPKL